MNMMLSWNWLRSHLPLTVSKERFAERMTEVGNSVERIYSIAERWKHIVVGEVVEVAPHPQADKLKIVAVNIGQSQPLSVVCGGRNVKMGQRVVLANIGANVHWHGEKERITLAPTTIRGVKSEGMICAAAEIGFAELPQGEHDIWDLEGVTDAVPGTPLANALGLEDECLFDIEVTTNRPDAKSIIGQAREAAVAFNETLQISEPTEIPLVDGVPLAVENTATHACFGYFSLTLDGITNGPSPWWMTERLLHAGVKPINAVVDITNYVLLEYGYPLHAFDAAAIHESGITIGFAQPEESFTDLGGQTHLLTERDLVIRSHTNVLALAGIIGGQASAVQSTTTNIVLEAAGFEPVGIRKSARAHHLSTDASQLFERTLHPAHALPALRRATELLIEICGARVARPLTAHLQTLPSATTFDFSPEKARGSIGTEISDDFIFNTLSGLGCKVDRSNGGSWRITAPPERAHDLTAQHDAVEEIARFFGYSQIPSRLPDGALPPVSQDPLITLERDLKERLAHLGWTESYNESFISDAELVRAGFEPAQTVRIDNPLSSEETALRPSLIPSLLTVVEQNQRLFGVGLSLFEIAPVYLPSKTSLPETPLILTVLATSKDGTSGFFRLKALFEHLVAAYRWPIALSERLMNASWHPGRSVQISDGTTVHGVLGELSPDILKQSGIESRATILELRLDTLVRVPGTVLRYEAPPTHPPIVRDLAVVIPESVAAADLLKPLTGISSLILSTALIDVYRGTPIDQQKKSCTLRLTFGAADRTLTSQEVDLVWTSVVSAIESRVVGAQVRIA